jgi:hypothetical protein
VASTTVYVNPAAKASGTGSITNPLNTWSGVTFTPGNTYLQMAGTTAKGRLMVTGSGTSASPIKIGAYGNGAVPAIAGSVIFDGASYVSLTGFSVTSPRQAAFVIQHGSNDIQVSSDTTSNSAIGVWIGNAAGGSNLISANTLAGNSLFGLAVDGVSNTAGNVFTNNAFEDFGALSMYAWAGTQGGNGAYWRSATGGSDWLGGVAQGVSVGSAGSGYAFDFAAASPFSADFRFARQTTGAYRA